MSIKSANNNNLSMRNILLVFNSFLIVRAS